MSRKTALKFIFKAVFQYLWFLKREFNTNISLYDYPQSDLLYISLQILELQFLSDRVYRIPILSKWSELTEFQLCHPDNANRISHHWLQNLCYKFFETVVSRIIIFLYSYFIKPEVTSHDQRKLNFVLGYISTNDIKFMNIKRIFGALLTVLGIGGLIYAAVLFANVSGGTHAIKEVIIYAVLGIIFFISGISLVRTVKDE